MVECDLCGPEKRTPWYYDGEEVRVLECDSCGVPMVVSVWHKDEPPNVETAAYALGIARGLFGPQASFRESGPNSTFEHWHRHIDT